GLPEAREPKAAEAALRRVETSAQKRLEAGRHLARRNRAVEDALCELEHARQAKAEAEAARDREAERERDARRALEQARDGLAEAYRLWSEAARELRPASIEALAEALVGWCERAEGVSPVQAAVAEAERAAAERLASLRAESQRRLRERESALAELRAERDRLLAGEHRPPPAPHTRDEGRRAGRAGAPLWRLCDFSAELTAAERAGLEAALESAGLLDAWVTPEGRLLDREERDVAVAVGTSPPPPEDRHLGLVLVPAVNRDDARCAAVSDETVRAVLRQIGWGEGAGTAWVAADGRWQLGPMHGAWSKAEAEHIGEGAREASRRQRLRALEPLIADAERELGAARRELESIASREQAAREEARRAPADDGVRRAVAELGAVARAVAQARQRLALAEEKVAERRARHAEAVSERDRDAKDLGVEAWVDDPRGLEDAVRGYQNALAGLRPRFEGHLAALEQAGVAEEAARGAAQAEARREQAALGARQRLAAAVQARDTLEQTVGAEAREVIARLQQARRRIAGLRGSEDEAKRRERELYGRTQRAEARIGEHRESLARQSEARDVALQALARFAGTGLFAVAHTELSEIEPGPWSASRGVEIARRIEQRLSSVESDDEAWKRNQSEIQRHVQTLISALGAQQLQPGYELVDELLVVSAVFQGQTRTMAQLAEDLNAEVTSRQTLLSARERELIENHLIGEVATHLHGRMRAAEALVRAMNEELEARPTSTGMKLKFVWEPREDERPGLAEARKRLLRTTATWTAAEREAVGAFLQREIARVRTEDEAGTWQEHLARALDYRAWHRFSVERFQDGRWKKLTRRTHGTGSGGEKAIALTVPKFAAAAAHYKSAAPCAPRLILLDEAFVGVDSDMRAKSMGLLHAFDLDFLMTSEREWGCYATLPGLAIYQLATRPGIDAVGVTRWLWNGRERAHLEHVVCPAAPPQGERAEAR
ncbi:MAG: TIGR02680 family protein, partial [Myxococcales bacterium]